MEEIKKIVLKALGDYKKKLSKQNVSLKKCRFDIDQTIELLDKNFSEDLFTLLFFRNELCEWLIGAQNRYVYDLAEGIEMDQEKGFEIAQLSSAVKRMCEADDKQCDNSCKHSIGDDHKELFEHDLKGLYVSYTCPKCGESIKDYYDLANRFNESKEMEEQIPETE